jgi:hypothetical protein
MIFLVHLPTTFNLKLKASLLAQTILICATVEGLWQQQPCALLKCWEWKMKEQSYQKEIFTKEFFIFHREQQKRNYFFLAFLSLCEMEFSVAELRDN